VLFADFSGFTRLAASMEPSRLILQLDGYFSRFDEIVEGVGLEKIKTIGDGYMAVGGLPEPNHTHPFDVALAALAMRELVRTMNREREMLHLTPWHLRIGLHTGPVIAGVVGSRKFAYDIWGDTVNVAARMQAGCRVGTIRLNTSPMVWLTCSTSLLAALSSLKIKVSCRHIRLRGSSLGFPAMPKA
jgi:adenylate cyclase